MRKLRGRPLVRRLEVVERREGEETFLIDERNGAIHTLNPVGAAIWGLLAEPVTMEAIVGRLAEAFPDTRKHEIERHVERLVRRLYGLDLVTVAAEAGKGRTT